VLRWGSSSWLSSWHGCCSSLPLLSCCRGTALAWYCVVFAVKPMRERARASVR
jgi:hypothetical protein